MIFTWDEDEWRLEAISGVRVCGGQGCGVKTRRGTGINAGCNACKHQHAFHYILGQIQHHKLTHGAQGTRRTQKKNDMSTNSNADCFSKAHRIFKNVFHLIGTNTRNAFNLHGPEACRLKRTSGTSEAENIFLHLSMNILFMMSVGWKCRFLPEKRQQRHQGNMRNLKLRTSTKYATNVSRISRKREAQDTRQKLKENKEQATFFVGFEF